MGGYDIGGWGAGDGLLLGGVGRDVFLGGQGFGCPNGVAGNQAFHLIATGFTGAAGELRVRVSGSDLIVLGDVNGDGVSDVSILVKNVASLAGTDFGL